MPNTRSQNIAHIADGCKVVPWPLGKAVTVHYRGWSAAYDIKGERPVFVPYHPSVGASVATNQFVIDGMRLAAQREIDKRKAKPLDLKSIVDEAFKRIAAEGTAFVGFDPAGKGSDFTSMFIHRPRHDRPGFEPRWFMFDEAPTRDPLTLKIQAMASMSFDKLALEYMTAKDRRHEIVFGKPDDQDHTEEYQRLEKIMNLADDIACARFGVGFYQPGA